MAEAAAVLGLVSSIASLIDLGVKIISRLKDFSQQTSEVPQTFQSLADRLPLLTQTLQRIQTRAQSGYVDSETATDLNTLLKSLQNQLEFLQQCLDRIIPEADASRWQRILKGLKSLEKDEKVKLSVDKIHSGIDVLVLHQTTNNVEVSDRILQKLEQFDLDKPPAQKGLGLCLNQAPLIEPDLFVGRKAELQQLHEWLSPDPSPQSQRLVSIVGAGGMGKTQLSLAYARAQGNVYSSVFWLDAKDETSLRQSMSALDVMISAQSTTSAASSNEQSVQVERVRHWLSEEWNNRWLLIFDNYDDPMLPNSRSSTSYEIRSFFPTRLHGSILLTTRSPKLTFSKRLTLQKIADVDQSVVLLSQRVGQDLTEDAHRLAVRLDGLPLALATAGMYIAQTSTPCAEYLPLYETAWTDLHGADSEELLEYEHRTLSSTWTLSLDKVRQQDPDAAELFQFLGYLSNQDIWYELVQAGASQGPSWMPRVTANKIRFDRSMAKLRDYSLVEAVAGTYRVHPCLHDWIVHHLNNLPSDELFLRALVCVTKTDVGVLHPQFSSKIQRVIKHAKMLQTDHFESLWMTSSCNPIVFDAFHSFGKLFQNWGEFTDGARMYERALEAKTDALGPEHESTLLTANALGRLYIEQGKIQEAEPIIERALKGSEKLAGPNSHSLMEESRGNFGWLLYGQRKFAEAEEAFKRMVEEREKEYGANHVITCMWEHAVGLLCVEQGKLVEAEQSYKRAMKAKEKAYGSDNKDVLDTVYNLGLLYVRCGRNSLAKNLQDEADDYYTRAETLLKRVATGCEKAMGPNHPDTLIRRLALGFAYLDHGKLDEAETEFSNFLSLRSEHEYSNTMIARDPMPQLAKAIWKSVAANSGNGDATNGQLAKLVRLCNRWCRKSPDTVRYLADSLINVDDIENGQIGWVLVKKLEIQCSTDLELGRVRCDGCRSIITPATGRHVCRTCADIDLCDMCMVKYASGNAEEFTDPTIQCRGHEFSDMSATAALALVSSEDQKKMDMSMDEWMDRLKKKYCSNENTKEP